MKSNNRKFPKVVNIHASLLLHLLLVMFMFFLCRMLFYVFNAGLFTDMTFKGFMRILWGGLRFDLTATLYTNILYVFALGIPFKFRNTDIYQKVAKWIFYITNGIAIALNCIDIIYYRFTFRRTTWSVFTEFSNDKGNLGLVGQFLIDYWYIILVYIALLFIMVKLYNLIKVGKPLIQKPLVYYSVNFVLLAVYAGLFVAGARGGFTLTTRPITISNAGAYIEKPIEAGLVLNTPFSIYRTLERVTYPRLDYFTKEQLDKLYTPIHVPNDSTVFTKKNVVIFIVESFSKEYFGSLNKDLDNGNYKGYTPFLDTLISQSYTFAHSFGNGLRSIDGMPSVLTSIPSFTDAYILSIYSNNTVKGLATLLREQGYDCSFFHGAPNGSMGFDAFAKSSGFEHYYGMKEYGNDNDFDGNWAIWDEPFLQFMASTLNTKQQPFFASVFTASSHHPFNIPKEYEGKFPLGTEQIHKCVGYTDMAIRRFFEAASKQPWYNNTIFVITADHTNQVSYEKSKTSIGPFLVPIIIFDPTGEVKGFEPTKTVQQIDIMPTVLGLIGYDKPYFAFGFDAFANDTIRDRFAINYINDFYHIYRNNFVLRSNIDVPEALYDYNNDPLLKNNLLNELADTATHLSNLGKAFRQSYNDRLIDNDMIAK